MLSKSHRRLVGMALSQVPIRYSTVRVLPTVLAVAAQHRTRLLPIRLKDKMPGAPAGPAHVYLSTLSLDSTSAPCGLPMYKGSLPRGYVYDEPEIFRLYVWHFVLPPRLDTVMKLLRGIDRNCLRGASTRRFQSSALAFC